MSSLKAISADFTSSPSIFNLAAIGLMLLIGGLGVAYWLDANVKPEPTPAPSVFLAPFNNKSLASVQLQIPLAWQHPNTPKGEGAGQTVNFVDLRLFLKFATDSKFSILNVRLAPAGANQPSAILLDSVYALRFSQKQISGPAGLIGKPLRQEDGFQNETVWYDPLSSVPFVAKCIDLGTQSSAPNCLRTVQISPRLIATYRFSADQLQYWRRFDETIEKLLSEIGV